MFFKLAQPASGSLALGIREGQQGPTPVATCFITMSPIRIAVVLLALLFLLALLGDGVGSATSPLGSPEPETVMVEPRMDSAQLATPIERRVVTSQAELRAEDVRPSRLHGRVIDENGQPVHDTVISIEALGHPLPMAKSALDGTYSMALPAKSEKLILRGDHLTEYVTQLDVVPGKDLHHNFVVRRGCCLRVTIVDSSGRSIPNARFTIYGAAHHFDLPARVRSWNPLGHRIVDLGPELVTDELLSVLGVHDMQSDQSTYEHAGWPEREFVFVASHPDYAGSLPVRLVMNGEYGNVVLRLRDAAHLDVKVITRARTPAAESLIGIEGPQNSSRMIRLRRTGPDGTLRIGRLPMGLFRVWLRAEGESIPGLTASMGTTLAAFRPVGSAIKLYAPIWAPRKIPSPGTMGKGQLERWVRVTPGTANTVTLYLDR